MTDKTQGQWNVQAERIKDRDELNAFIETVPISMRMDVKRHLQTVWAIAEYHKRQGDKKGKEE